MKDKILILFFDNKMSQKEIAEKLHISKSYVSKIVTEDSRYAEYKNQKISNNKLKHNQAIKEKVKEYRKAIQFSYAVDNLVLKEIHNQDIRELSKAPKMSNEAYRRWNSSAYKYNPSKNRYEFDEKLCRPNDAPKFVKERLI